MLAVSSNISIRQNQIDTVLGTRPQSALRGPKPLRCFSPIIRAGFIVGQTNGQSFPVTEFQPTVGREIQPSWADHKSAL